MRISAEDADGKGVISSTTSPKVNQLIQQLSDRPLLIDKITINQRQILLDLMNNQVLSSDTLASKSSNNLATKTNSTVPSLLQKTPINQIQLPLSAAEKLGQIAQQGVAIVLQQNAQSTRLNLVPIDQVQTQSLTQAQNLQKLLQQPDIMTLLFQKAQIKVDKLILTQPNYSAQASDLFKAQVTVGNNASINSHTPLNTLTPAKSTLANQQANLNQSNLNTANLKSPELQSAISQFLKAKPINQTNTAAALNQLLKFESLLSQQINTIESPLSELKKGFDTNALTNKVGQSQQKTLSNLFNYSKPINELLALSNKLTSINQKNIKHLSLVEGLLKQVNQLKQQLDFSVNNKNIKLEERISQSGHFTDAKIGSPTINQSAKEGFNRLTQPTNNGQTIDLKLLNLVIKQQIESAISSLNSTHPQLLKIPQLMQLVLQDPLIKAALQSLEINSSAQLSKSNEAIASLNPQQQSAESQLAKQIEQLNLSSQLKQWLNRSAAHPGNFSPQLTQKQELQLIQQQQIILRDMLTETNQLISKIETNQLLSLKSDASLLQQYLLDIPILHQSKVESFELLFQSKDKDNNKKQSKVWTVSVRFDLEPLGPMFARISLKDQRISTHFFAEDKATAKLLSEHMDHLKNSLFKAGLDVDEISGQQGIVPETLKENNEHSVDVHA